MTSQKWGKPANMDGDVEMVESWDQEMYRRRHEPQIAISVIRAYICISKKKSQKLDFVDYMEPKAWYTYVTLRAVQGTIIAVEMH